MVLTLERESSLCDLRRHQRRVAALMIRDCHVDLQKYPLRKRVLPQGYCYVCSRVDPSGIFRNPNSYLFKKGFLHNCEHFPQAPFTTFVRDDGLPLEREETLPELGTNPNAAPSISVTIRKDNRSRSTKISLSKREGSSVSAFEKLCHPNDVERISLPSIPTLQDGRRSKTMSEAKLSHKTFTLKASSGGASRHSKTSLPQKPQIESEAKSVQDDRITIPTAKNDADESAISGLSPFRETGSNKSANEIDSIFDLEKDAETINQSKTNDSSTKISSHKQSAYISTSVQAAPYINQSDGLQGQFIIEPLVRDEPMLRIIDDFPIKRPHAGRMRERRLPSIPTDRTSARSTSTYRPGSGHLRYHHRIDEDSVPNQGFEIPPTPFDDVMSYLDPLTPVPGKETDSYSRSSKGQPDSSLSDDASLNLTDGKTSGMKSRRSVLTSDPGGLCRCPSHLREVSFERNICRTCGKAFNSGTNESDVGGSRLSDSDVDGSRLSGSDVGGGSRVTTKTKRQSKNESGASSSKMSLSQRITSQQQQQQQREEARMNQRSKACTDEDYMDLNSIIHEDDGHYFSGDDDEEFSVEQSPVSWFRYRHALPLPLIDPDIHKLAYLRALKEAKLKHTFLSEDFDLEETPTLRRATVFSYIPLLPYRAKEPPKNIGLRPDDSNAPKKGQFMKHIFGDVNPDDFYPGGKVITKSKVIIDNSNDSSTTPVSTDRTDPQSTKEPQFEPERSSVSLKMRNIDSNPK
ncbi:hypothetical protein ACF0H5_022491 [Mactra antiquata]